MAEPITTCPIWGTRYKAKGTYDTDKKTYEVTDSDRAFTGYNIGERLLDRFVKPLSDSKRAQLTTWLIDQWSRGNDQPEVTIGVLLGLRYRRPLAVHVRADRLLKLISLSTRAQQLGEFARYPPHWYKGLAWSESIDQSDVKYLLSYLERKGWLERNPYGPEFAEALGWRVSVEGHARVDELQNEEKATNSLQTFVAMWFHESMTEVFEQGIEPAILETGYEPLRIDQKEHINRIDDEIIAEIRRSRFLIADFTHGEDGARGGVYYEAGFAHGLGIPVIFTCREDAVDTLHFDINHYNHIVWRTPEDLREKLENRIRANIDNVPRLYGDP